MALRKDPTISLEDYLMLDQNSKSARYEYLDGELRMLAGGSVYHSVITTRLSSVLERHLEDSSCWVYSSDMKLQLSESIYVYPDIMISCDPRDQEVGQTIIHYPSLVVEVLSPGTEMIDRREKLISYQNCSTIHTYIMVDSQSIRIEMYQREDGGWKHQVYGPDDTIHIKAFAITFPIASIYRGMKLTGMCTGKNKQSET